MEQAIVNVSIAFATFIGIPWVVWVSKSLSNQKTEIALLKQEIGLLDRITSLLEKRETSAH